MNTPEDPHADHRDTLGLAAPELYSGVVSYVVAVEELVLTYEPPTEVKRKTVEVVAVAAPRKRVGKLF